jgi:hypothetical protein
MIMRDEKPADLLPAYQAAINAIDDYFEYISDCENDRAEVYSILSDLTARLKKESGS